MVGRKVIEVVESMLSGAQEVVGVGFRQDRGVNGDAQRKDGTAGL